MKVHVDGARLQRTPLPLSAAAAPGFTTDVGVDVVSFGGTKNGLLYGEAVVVVGGDDLGLKYLRKTNMQLPSKMRFVSAQPGQAIPRRRSLWLESAHISCHG